MNNVVLKQSSGPPSSGSLKGRFGKAKSSDVAQSISKCSILFCALLRYLHSFGNAVNDKLCGENYRFSFYLVCDEIE